MESGDDETLRRIDKGGTVAECIDTAAELRRTGLVTPEGCADQLAATTQCGG